MSDCMLEVERLVSELIDAAHGTVLNEDQSREDEARAALLAHIQRGAVLEGWKEATIAWEVCASIHREYAKKKDPFFTTRQADFVKHTEAARSALLAAAPAPDQFLDAAKMVAGPAEVPMPEPDTHCYDEDERRDVWSHSADQMLAYGVACRAAGEAAGYARGLADERERCASVAWAHYMDTCRRKGIGPDVLPDWCCAAALRGEVKP